MLISVGLLLIASVESSYKQLKSVLKSHDLVKELVVFFIPNFPREVIGKKLFALISSFLLPLWFLFPFSLSDPLLCILSYFVAVVVFSTQQQERHKHK